MAKIKVGFVGAGWMGSVQMQRITERDDAEIVALSEKNQERGKEILKGLGLSEDLLVDDYQQIVDGGGQAPEKLRKLAAVFEDGLSNKKLCLVGSISTNSNTLQDSSCNILQSTIENTVSIFAAVFEQGRQEESLTFTGTDDETAFAFLSLLIGAQTIARSHGGVQLFHQAAEVFISGIEK